MFMFDRSIVFLAFIIIVVTLTPSFAMGLQPHEFSHGFKMDVPLNSSFEEVPILIDPDPYGTTIYEDSVNDINVTFFAHCEKKTFVGDKIIDLVDNHDFELTRENGLHILSNGSLNIVVFDKDEKVVAISSSDMGPDMLKAMAYSIEF